MSKIFNQAIGNALAALRGGLFQAVFPRHFNVEDLQEIVQAVNSKVPTLSAVTEFETVPHAVLVLPLAKLQNAGISGAVTIKDALEFGQNERLLVVEANSGTNQSVETSFKLVLGESFPDQIDGRLTWDHFGAEALKIILTNVGFTYSGGSGFQIAAGRLGSIFETLAIVHKELTPGQSSKDWNALWYEHCLAGLETLNSRIVLSSDEVKGFDLEDWLKDYSYASFGLPHPKDGQQIAPTSKNIGKDFKKAIETWWADIEVSKKSLEYLRTHPDTIAESHPLESLDWETFETSRLSHDSQLLGFLALSESDQHALDAFRVFTERQFFHPIPPAERTEPIKVLDESGMSLEVASLSPSSVHLCELLKGSNVSPRTEKLTIVVPLRGTPTAEDLAATFVSLSTGNPTYIWVQESSEFSGESLEFEGYFTFKGDDLPQDSLVKGVNLSIDMSNHDPLAGLVDRRVHTNLLVAPTCRSAIGVWQVQKSGAAKVVCELSTNIEDDPGKVNDYELAEVNSKVFTLIVGENPRIDGLEISQIIAGRNCFGATVKVESSATIVVSDDEYILKSPHPKLSAQSPVIAALRGVPLSTDDLDSGTLNSVRARLEKFISHQLETHGSLLSLGHFALGMETQSDFETVHEVRGMNVLGGAENQFDSLTNFKLAADFEASLEVQKFIQAFDALGIISLLRARSQNPEVPDYVSRTSFAHLWSGSRHLLDGYLSAYEDMVTAAHATGNPSNIFWATYPLSFSIWDLESTGKCQGVMLSPLHPIRLGWIAAVEDTFRQSDEPFALAGTVEGWNFPALGPSNTANGSFVAIPIDNGAGQIFLGWSMLVSASIQDPESLFPPLKVAGIEAPGSASGGMNSTSAVAALKAYRRINPHVSTLSLDLANSTEAPRLIEMDQAITSFALEIGKDKKEDLPGGFRIWDSTHRRGEPPFAEINGISRAIGTRPFIWSRYIPNTRESISCNIRLLQDSGVKLAVTSNNAVRQNLGVLGEIPLRRFESLSSQPLDMRFSESNLTLPDNRTNPFSRALRAAERSFSFPLIQAQIHNSILIDDRAEWTVAGESMVSPGSISAMLTGSRSANQMLWEWRPPFLSDKDDGILEKRPFIAIARIPASFKEQLGVIIAKAKGESGSSPAAVDKILAALGGRGVGLSSLLSMGGTHTSGALGFYIVLDLIAKSAGKHKNVFVMPIDACEPFLQALAGSSEEAEFTRRADLLAFSFSESGLVISPIEIKLYGLGREVPSTLLPNAESEVLSEAKNQLLSTMALLERVVARGQHVSATNLAEKTLWLNGLTSLVEAAVKMSELKGKDSVDLRNNLQALANGGLDISLGKPIITYFGHTASTADGEYVSTTTVNSDSKFSSGWGLLSANVSKALQLIEDGEGAIFDVWEELFDWALEPQKFWSVDLKTGQADSLDGPPGASGFASDDVRDIFNKSDYLDDDVTVIADSDSGASVGDSFVETDSKESSGDQSDDDGDGDEGGAPVDANGTPSIGPNNHGISVPKTLVGEPPSLGEGIRVKVGTLREKIGEPPAYYWPGNTELTHMNLGVVGDLGTGKTEFLKALITNLRDDSLSKQGAPISFLIFDYKDDYSDPKFVARNDVLHLSPTHIPLNVFELDGPYDNVRATKRARAFANSLAKIYSNVGPVQTENLIETIAGLFKLNNGVAPTMKEVLNRYKEIAGKIDAVVSILSTFVRSEVFTEDRAAMKSFTELIDGRVLVVDLNSFGADRASQNALVVIFLDLYYVYMSGSTKWGFEGTKPNQIRRLNSYLLVDEAVNILKYEFDVLSQLLLKGRQFGFGVILSVQYLSHLKTTHINYGEPLLTWVIHKVPQVKLSELQSLGIPRATQESVDRIVSLKPHEAFFASYQFEGILIRGLPFFEME